MNGLIDDLILEARNRITEDRMGAYKANISSNVSKLVTRP
jgi:hypothetical protein